MFKIPVIVTTWSLIKIDKVNSEDDVKFCNNMPVVHSGISFHSDNYVM